MKVLELLESKGKNIISIDAESSVEDAIALMHSKKISAVIVTSGGKTAGIFTERDVVRSYIAAKSRHFREVKVREGMVADLIVAVPQDDLNDIAAVMVEKNIRHLPVVEGRKIIGMLSMRDVIQAQVRTLTSNIHYLKDYISGS